MVPRGVKGLPIVRLVYYSGYYHNQECGQMGISCNVKVLR